MSEGGENKCGIKEKAHHLLEWFIKNVMFVFYIQNKMGATDIKI